MNNSEQIEYLKVNETVQDRLDEERKNINEKIKESDLGLERKQLNDRIKEAMEENGLANERRELSKQIRESSLGRKRGEINAKMREVRADEKTVKWAKGKTEDMQLNFKFETEDPDQLMADVRKKPVKKEKKKKEEKAEAAA